MDSYIAAVGLAICLVMGLFCALEMTSANPVFAQDLRNTPAHELIDIAQDEQASDSLRVKAIVQLVQRPMSIDSTVPVLARLCVDRNPRLRMAAENAISEIGESAAPFLKPFFEGGSREETLAGCSAAHAIGPSCEMYLPQLKKLLDSGDKADRRSALFALKGIGKPGIGLIDGVIECLSSEDLNVKCMACRVLKTYGTEAGKAESELIRLLREDVPSVRGLAAICLSTIGPNLKNKGADVLIAQRLQGDGKRPVLPIEHQRYLEALAKFGSKSEKHLGTIRKGLTHHSTYVRGYSAFAIYQITGNPDETKQVFEGLVSEQNRAPQALDVIAEMGEEATLFLPIVERCLMSDSLETRVMALAAVMSIGTKEQKTIEKVKVLVHDSDSDVRAAASEALRSLTDPKADADSNDSEK